jgi:hypothetical protein
VKPCVDFTKLAARRLLARRGTDIEGRAASVRQAMRDAMVRLDWREARRQAEVLQSMGAGVCGPMIEAERTALFAKLQRLIAKAKARPSAPDGPQ